MIINKNRNIVSADANSNVLVRGKAGILSMVTINKTSAHALAFYDGIDTTTLSNNTLLFTLKASIVEASYIYNIAVSKGLVVSVPASYAGDAAVLHAAG